MLNQWKYVATSLSKVYQALLPIFRKIFCNSSRFPFDLLDT